MLNAINVRYPDVGGVEKRPGFDSALADPAFLLAGGNGISIAQGRGKVIGFRDELVVSDGRSVGSLKLSSNSARLVYKGKAPDAVATMEGVTATPYSLSQPDVAVSSDGQIFYAWSDSPSLADQTGNIYVTVQDATTGADIVSAVSIAPSISTAGLPKLVAIGSSVLLFFKRDTAAINCLVWNPATLQFGSLLNPIINNLVGGFYDVCTDGTSAFVVYANTSSILTVARVNTAGAQTAIITSSEPSTNTNWYGICANAGERVWVTYTTGTAVRAAAFALDLSSQTIAPFTVYTASGQDGVLRGTAVARLTSTTAVALIYSSLISVQGQAAIAPVFNTSGAIVGNATGANRKTHWVRPGSKPFVASSSPMRCLAWVYAGGAAFDAPALGEQPLQYTFVLVDLGCDDTTSTALQARPIAALAPRTAVITDLGTNGEMVPAVGQLNSTQWVAPLRTRLSATGRLGLAGAVVDLEHPGHLTHAELGQTLLAVPGFYWDRTGFAEVGFSYWPQILAAPVFGNVGGGVLVPGQTHRWRVLYEYVDANGFVHRSQPSDFVEATVSVGNNTATFAVPSQCLTARQGEIRLALYRTDDIVVDPNTYYRVHADESAPKNVRSAESVSVVDLGTKQLDTLYTQGGALPNVMPSGCTAMVTYRNRIWIAYGNTVQYSKAFVTGEAVSFTDAFTLPLEESGDITALWVQDDTLYISTANRIYYLQADGPADNGTQNDVRTPNTVATDLGVTEPRSVVVTSIGTIYQSATGLQLLSRGREVSAEPFGSRVQAELSTYPEITSAIVHPSGSYIMLTAVNATTGIRLIFDYAANKWAKDVLFGGSNFRVLSTGVSRGTVYFLGGGSVLKETPAASLDLGSWVTATIDTAWFKGAGLQGYQQIAKHSLQCEKLSDCDVRIRSYVDYDETVVDDETWLANSGTKPISAMTIPEFETTPSRERVQAMRWTISDATPTGGTVGTGRGMSFVGLALELDVLNETFRMPAGQKG